MPKPLIDAALLAGVQNVVARHSAMDLLGRLPMARAPGRPDASWYRINRVLSADQGGDAPAPATAEVDILLYDEIGWWGVTASDFVRDLAAVQADVINLHINSPGGSVFDGIAIYQALAQHKARIVVHIDGWAASIASIIAMAGDEIRIGEAAQVMIHKPWSFVIGNDEDMRKEADVLASLGEALIDVYVARTEGDRAEIAAWVAAETWFKGQAAVDAGFADVVVPLKLKDSTKPAARLGADFFASIFPHLPADLRASLAAPAPPAASIATRRQFQAFLRDCGGFSGSQARAIANSGFRLPSDPPGGADDDLKPAATDPRDEAAGSAEVAAAFLQAAANIRNLMKI